MVVMGVVAMAVMVMMRIRRRRRMLHELFSGLLQVQEQILTTVCVRNPNLYEFGEYGRAFFLLGAFTSVVMVVMMRRRKRSKRILH